MTVRAFLDDERGIVASFLIKVVLGLALVGTILIEGGSILFTKLRVQDVAESAATAGVGELNTLRNCTAAGDAAFFTVHDKDPRAALKSYECHSDGRFTVVVSKRANTLYVHQIGFLKDFVTATSRVTAEPAAPNF
jgi:Flp pilus assembly protein TadG